MTSDTNSNKTGASHSGSDISEEASSTTSEFLSRSSDALAKLTDTAQHVAQQAAQQASQQASAAATSLASEVGEQFSGLLSAQIDAGADLVDQVADAAKGVADNLDRTAPQLASMIRNAAQSVEEFARDVRGRSLAEIVDMTSQYARRQPAIFVGAAVASGFLLARFVKSSAQTSSSATPSQNGSRVELSRPRSDEVRADTRHDA